MPISNPQLTYLNSSLISELTGCQVTSGTESASESDQLAQFFAGQSVPPNLTPVAQAYGGHQFGQWNPMLGDGRALLLGEFDTPAGRIVDLALKGSGRTPFSRGGDGMAALGPMLREVLISEFLAACHVPTTRCAAVVSTNVKVVRQREHPGAVLARTAASHIRVGTFEWVAQHGTLDLMRELADHEISRNYPEINSADSSSEANRYHRFVLECARRQAGLVSQWLGLGFIHGVMNTDNTACSGESIDFGPCAFMEEFDPTAVFSSIDTRGRYAYQKQPEIAVWNIRRLTAALAPLLCENPNSITDICDGVAKDMIQHSTTTWADTLRAKFGLAASDLEDDQIIILAAQWFGLLQRDAVDFTNSWRLLAEATRGNPEPLRDVCKTTDAVDAWLRTWNATDAGVDAATQADHMDAVNPCHIPRNHLVEEALDAAENGNLEPFQGLLEAIQSPFSPGDIAERYRQPAPAGFTESFRTFCGT